MSLFTELARQDVHVFRLLAGFLCLVMFTGCAASRSTPAVDAEKSPKDRLARLTTLMSKRYSAVGAKDSPRDRHGSQVIGQVERAVESPEDATRARSPTQEKPGESPKCRYIRQVTTQIEKKWHLYRRLRRDGVMGGSLEISFCVNKKGKVEELRIVNDKDSNPALTDFTLQAIKDADILPIPAEVLPSLPMNDQDRLKVEYNVLIY